MGQILCYDSNHVEESTHIANQHKKMRSGNPLKKRKAVPHDSPVSTLTVSTHPTVVAGNTTAETKFGGVNSESKEPHGAIDISDEIVGSGENYEEPVRFSPLYLSKSNTPADNDNGTDTNSESPLAATDAETMNTGDFTPIVVPKADSLITLDKTTTKKKSLKRFLSKKVKNVKNFLHYSTK